MIRKYYEIEVSKFKEDLANKKIHLSLLKTDEYARKKEVHDLQEQISWLKNNEKSYKEKIAK